MNSINGYYKAIRNILFTNQKIDFCHFDHLPDLYGHRTDKGTKGL